MIQVDNQLQLQVLYSYGTHTHNQWFLSLQCYNTLVFQAFIDMLVTMMNHLAYIQALVFMQAPCLYI